MRTPVPEGEPEYPFDAGRSLAVFSLDQLQQLISTLQADGFVVIGPTVRDRTVVYAEISSIGELPAGELDEQKPGSYRLEKRADAVLFGHGVGPQSVKSYLFPSAVRLWSARPHKGGLDFDPEHEAPPRLAFIGVRPCELAAVAIQDRVFLGGPYIDPIYASRREGMFVVAVNCGRAGGTCFCASMGTGPAATSGFDLALTEIVESGQ
ncbi:MAG: sulfite reductase subunit A, partial [Thermoanaerobaculia bacterium]